MQCRQRQIAECREEKKKKRKDGKYYAVDVCLLLSFFGHQVVAIVRGLIVISLWAPTNLHREVGLRRGEDVDEGVFAGIVMDVGGVRGRLKLWWEEKTDEL